MVVESSIAQWRIRKTLKRLRLFPVSIPGYEPGNREFESARARHLHCKGLVEPWSTESQLHA
jgi:hypothetical protein